MARYAAGATIERRTATGKTDIRAAGGVPDPVPATTYATTYAALAAAIAVLVADGASPTQAHVTTANNALTAFAADLASGVPVAHRDVVISFDASTVVTKTALREAVRSILQAVEGSNALTP